MNTESKPITTESESKPEPELESEHESESESEQEPNLNRCEECGAKWGNCDCNPELCEECGADDDNDMYEGRLLCCVCIECYEEQEEE